MEKIAIKKIRNSNISEAIESAIELIGGIERFISQGDKVLIKPTSGFSIRDRIRNLLGLESLY